MSQSTGNPEQDHEDDLRMLASADAVGALSKKEQHDLEYQEAIAEPRVRKAMWDTREGVMKQMRADLPDVEPESSLKHRVLASVLRVVESDFAQSVGVPAPLPGVSSTLRRNWIERLVGGRVSPIWRVAALVLMTISAGLFWNLTAAMNQNDIMLSIARDNETENFREYVGLESFEFLMNPLAEHVAFEALDDDLGARAFFSYFPGEDQALFHATGLPHLSDGEYFLRIDSDDPDRVPYYISFTPQGQVTGIDVKIPSGFEIASSEMWVVIRVNNTKTDTTIMKSIS